MDMKERKERKKKKKKNVIVKTKIKVLILNKSYLFYSSSLPYYYKYSNVNSLGMIPWTEME